MVWSNKRARELRDRAMHVIPGGMYGHQSTMLLPVEFPQFFASGKGSRLWDADGNEYVDFLCGYGTNLLGYGFEPVEAAAAAQQALGDTMTGPSEIMVDLAEAFVGMVSHADWAMFCKNGTDATSMAMVVARAHTGCKTILCARGAYHGAAPWSTPLTAGTLPEDRAHVAYYNYNDALSLADAFAHHEGDVAAVFATPFRHEVFADQYEPTLEYVQAARSLCDDTGALLVVDDIRAGFRLARDSSWAPLGVAPDLSTWGKSFANGYPISALLGGDLVREAAAKVYVTGSFWFAATPMAAAIETLRQIRETDYLERLTAAGSRFRDELDRQAADHGFTLRQTGPVQMPQVLFEEDPDFRVGYAWVTECLKRGALLSPYHNMFLSSAHTETDIDHTLTATDGAFGAIRRRLAHLEAHPIAQLIAAAH